MYYNKIVDDQKQNSKETWKILNTIINKRQNESSYPDSFITGGTTVSNKNDIADGFNHFFANIGNMSFQTGVFPSSMKLCKNYSYI